MEDKRVRSEWESERIFFTALKEYRMDNMDKVKRLLEKGYVSEKKYDLDVPLDDAKKKYITENIPTLTEFEKGTLFHMIRIFHIRQQGADVDIWESIDADENDLHVDLEAYPIELQNIIYVFFIDFRKVLEEYPRDLGSLMFLLLGRYAQAKIALERAKSTTEEPRE